MKRTLFLAFCLAASPLAALAANEVAVPEDITLILPSDSTEYALKAGSSFDSLTIQSSSFDFVFSSGGIIRITSANKKKLTNTLNRTYSCEANQSSLNMTHLSTDAEGVTVTITPSGTCTSADSGSSSTGSGGIISGGGGASAPSIPPQTPSAPPPTPAPATTPTGLATALFARDLAMGTKNNDVSRLQAFLASEKELYPEGLITGYYGSLTRAAVIRFQAKYGIAQVGRVGPETRAKLEEVFGKATPAAPEVAQASPAAVSVSPVFNSSLSLGARNDDVKRLQQLLNSDPEMRVAASGVGSPGEETTYFGALTERAVQKFQEKYGVAKAGEAGYGHLGPKTRAKLEEVFGGAPAVPAPAPVSKPPPAPAPETKSELPDFLKLTPAPAPR